MTSMGLRATSLPPKPAANNEAIPPGALMHPPVMLGPKPAPQQNIIRELMNRLQQQPNLAPDAVPQGIVKEQPLQSVLRR
jgi:hypothetical protein